MSLRSITYLYITGILIYGVIPTIVVRLGDISNIPILTQIIGDNLNQACVNKILTRTFLHIGMLGFFVSIDLKRFRVNIADSFLKTRVKISFLVVLILLLLCMAPLIYFSKPVDGYHDVYRRYMHLSGLTSVIISILLRFYRLLLVITVYYSFNSKKIVRYLSLLLVVMLEYNYNHGSRIFIFMLLLEFGLLTHLYIRKLSLFSVLLGTFLLVVSMTLIEYMRMSVEMDITLPSELGAVFFSAYQICNNPLEGTTLLMPFYYLFSPFILGRFTLHSPLYWYTRSYWEYMDFPPFTLGPIAESFMYGDYVYIVIYSFVTSWVLKFLTNILRNKPNTIGNFLGIYGLINFGLSYKYSSLYIFTDIFKSIVPLFLFFIVVKYFKTERI